MAATKKTRATHQNTNGSFGLLANGSCGPWEVAIDEATSGADRWWAQIEGPSVSFSFEIASLDIVDKIIRFLEPSGGRSRSLVIAKDKKTPITLLKDDEYADRFFVVAGSMHAPVVRFVIAGADVAKLVNALRQVEEDLED